MTKSELACKLLVEDNGLNCAGSVVAAYTEELGITLNEAKKITSLFGKGMCESNQTCGALTGAFIVYGLLKGGNGGPTDFPIGKKLASDFNSKLKSLACDDLLEEGTPCTSEVTCAVDLLELELSK